MFLYSTTEKYVKYTYTKFLLKYGSLYKLEIMPAKYRMYYLQLYYLKKILKMGQKKSTVLTFVGHLPWWVS